MTMTKMVNGVEVPLTQAEIDAFNAREAAYTTPVPSSITSLQLRKVLTAQGLRASAEAIVAAAETPQNIKDSWEYAAIFERYNPDLVAMATALGLSESQTDDLFIAAAQL